MTAKGPREIAGVAELTRLLGWEDADPAARSKVHARLRSEWAPPGTRLAIGTIRDLKDAVWFLELEDEHGNALPAGELEDAVKRRRRPYEPAPGGWAGRAEIVAATAEDPVKYGARKGYRRLGPNVIDRVLSNPENLRRKGITVAQLGNGRAYWPSWNVLALLEEPRPAGYPHRRRLASVQG